MTTIIAIFMGSNLLKEKLEKGEISRGLTTSKWQSWTWNLVLLPHITLDNDWHQDWGEGSLGKSPQNLRLLFRPTVSTPSPPSLA